MSSPGLAYILPMRMSRTLLIVAVSCGTLVFTSAPSTALVARGNDPCDALVDLDARVDELESSRAFDAAGYRQIRNDFKKAAKSAPKVLQSAMKQLAKLYGSVGKAKSESDGVTAYGNGLVKYDKAVKQFNTYLAEKCAGAAGSGSSTSSGSGAGTLTLGGETITLESSRCFLQEQTAAGQKILWTAQASGTNAAGDDVIVDVSRYDASSQFAGDDLSVDIGDPRSPSFVGWGGRYATGTIFLSGKTVSGSGLEVTDDDLQTVTVTFDINC